jgi:DNA invertase Pin-like site-specific DNA recombinase
MNFAFYGRVSTEDQQDPASSKAWQLDRARGLIQPHSGAIVSEFFDVGQSRSLPWRRRPEAGALLDLLKDPGRGFGAVVIGEPARAFAGAEFAMVFPVFTHYSVELWVPEVGGRVDPGSEAHDLVMMLFGGMSKGERNRIKMRVRGAMTAQARDEGRFLGGRPPYGYTLADIGAHPNPAKAAAGVQLHQLERDPVAAPVVERIFHEYVEGRGLFLIAEGLTGDGIPSPSAHDPARNRHRLSTNGAWSKYAVRSILRNPRYTGRQVWNRQSKCEELIDVENVALGHATKQRWNDASEWVWSSKPTHEAIVSSELFARAQRMMAAGRRRPLAPKRRRQRNSYALSGLVVCGLCGRKMSAQAKANTRHVYRCRFPEQYALKAELSHPRSVAVSEALMVERLDEWLMHLFDPERLGETVQALLEAQEGAQHDAARVEAARRKLADCDRRLVKFRQALEADADPRIVGVWIKDVQAERLAAERDLAKAEPSRSLTREELESALAEIDVGEAIRSADARAKRDLYASLGVSLTYYPEERLVRAEAGGWGFVRVGGGTRTPTLGEED